MAAGFLPGFVLLNDKGANTKQETSFWRVPWLAKKWEASTKSLRMTAKAKAALLHGPLGLHGASE